VVLFPEGTSSDGREVLPFKSSLLEPVQGVPHAVYAAHVSYHRADGSPASRVPYWGEMTLLPHMISLLGQPRVSARVSLHRVDSLPADRKELARHLQSEVARLAATE